ncbi:MAG: DUF2442 domain-containing protein [Nitrospirae bacterium]|nr:DUF2442 domain-containing protein [Candidatus Troglogloeales bacterium]
MECISISEARYVKDFRVFLKFNTGETGEVDIQDLVYKYQIAEPLRNPEVFSHFYLDSWPTLAWDCGFDIDPESLYFRATGKALWEPKVP